MKIDDHIPAPTPALEKYPFKRLQVGQSFFVPGQNTRGHTAGSAHVFAHRQRARGFTFRVAIRTVEEDGVRGVRIWRIE